MVDRFAWAADELIPGDEIEDVEETDVQEGRHSAGWKEDLHPRDGDGQFTSGGGGSSGGSGGDSSGGSSNSAPSGGGRRGRPAPGDDARGDSSASSPEIGGNAESKMPSVLASNTVKTSGGDVTLDRHVDGGLTITTPQGSATFTKYKAADLMTVFNAAGSEDDASLGMGIGDEFTVKPDLRDADGRPIPGMISAMLSRTGRNAYELRVSGEGQSYGKLKDAPALSLKEQDFGKLLDAQDRLDSASRVDTGNGDVDVFTDGKKIGFRALGDDGRPVETLFTRGDFDKIDGAVNDIIDEIDFPDTPGAPVTRKIVSTQLGKVRVEIFGDWRAGGPGNRLEIEPVDGGWGVVVDGNRRQDWERAIDQFKEASKRATGAARALSGHVTLTEAATGQAVRGRRFRARLIAGDVQGSSGYYPAAMLQQHASVFREGLPVYLDHPGITEQHERPERSVRDLAGKLATTAVYERDGLYADIQVYPHWADVVEAMADDIGMSIRAAGTVEASTQRGIRGPIVTSLTEASSVDFVTVAGAGGKLVQLLESARAGNLAPPFKSKKDKAKDADDEDEKPDDEESDDTDEDEDDAKKKGKKGKLPAFLAAKFKAKEAEILAEAGSVGASFESLLHSSFTQFADGMYGEGRLTRDERKSLSSAVGEALDAFTSRVEADAPDLYQRDLWADPKAAQTHDTDMKGAPMSGSTITEQSPPERGTEVTEADTALTAALAEAKQSAVAFAEAQAEATRRIEALEARLVAADVEKLGLTNDRAARVACAEALRTSGLHAVSHARVTESVVRDLPTGEDGRLDTVRLGESIRAAIDGERTYVASLAEATGAGMPRGLGESLTPSEPLTESAFESSLVAQFERLGMSPAAAKVAALGRR